METVFFQILKDIALISAILGGIGYFLDRLTLKSDDIFFKNKLTHFSRYISKLPIKTIQIQVAQTTLRLIDSSACAVKNILNYFWLGDAHFRKYIFAQGLLLFGLGSWSLYCYITNGDVLIDFFLKMWLDVTSQINARDVRDTMLISLFPVMIIIPLVIVFITSIYLKAIQLLTLEWDRSSRFITVAVKYSRIIVVGAFMSSLVTTLAIYFGLYLKGGPTLFTNPTEGRMMGLFFIYHANLFFDIVTLVISYLLLQKIAKNNFFSLYAIIDIIVSLILALVLYGLVGLRLYHAHDTFYAYFFNIFNSLIYDPHLQLTMKNWFLNPERHLIPLAVTTFLPVFLYMMFFVMLSSLKLFLNLSSRFLRIFGEREQSVFVQYASIFWGISAFCIAILSVCE